MSSAFRRFTYVIAHSPTLPLLYLRHSSFSNPSVASPTSQFILQPFFRFSYLTGFSLTSPGEPPRPFLPTSSPLSIFYLSSFPHCLILVLCHQHRSVLVGLIFQYPIWVKTVVNSLKSENAKFTRNAQELYSNSELKGKLAYIKSHFGSISPV